MPCAHACAINMLHTVELRLPIVTIFFTSLQQGSSKFLLRFASKAWSIAERFWASPWANMVWRYAASSCRLYNFFPGKGSKVSSRGRRIRWTYIESRSIWSCHIDGKLLAHGTDCQSFDCGRTKKKMKALRAHFKVTFAQDGTVWEKVNLAPVKANGFI